MTKQGFVCKISREAARKRRSAIKSIKDALQMARRERKKRKTEETANVKEGTLHE